MSIQYIIGDVFEVMKTLKDDSVDLILTSPPFLALRSYLAADHPDKGKEIGSEATPAEYIDVLLRLTAEWRRLLAPHGSLVVELGDTYSGSGGGGGDYLPGGWREGQQNFAGSEATMKESNAAHWRQKNQRSGWRRSGNEAEERYRNLGAVDSGSLNAGPGWPLPKSLTLIPESYRFALAYGINPHTGTTSPAGQWRVRNVIRWVRPNPPVGALGDKFRPATSELVVACTSKDRWFDLDAVRAVWPSELCVKPIKAMCPREVCRTCGEPRRRITSTYIQEQQDLAKHIRKRRLAVGLSGNEVNDWFPESKSNWIGHWEDHKSQPLIPSVAHWEVIKPRLGLSDDYDHLIYGDRSTIDYVADDGSILTDKRTDYDRGGTGIKLGNNIKASRHAPDDWSDCAHDDYRPGLVLDPFAGTGTTLAVAHGHGRDAIGIDIDEKSAELARDRVGPLFLEIV